MSRAARSLRPRLSAVLAAVLACAQLVVAVGRPVVAGTEQIARCGCASPSVCATGGCGCPVPEPVAECCGCCGNGPVRCGTKSKCCSKPAGGMWRVDWLASLEAGGCQKAPPAGTTPAEPSVPPMVLVEVAVLTPGEPVLTAGIRPASVPTFPPDPPPRRAGS